MKIKKASWHKMVLSAFFALVLMSPVPSSAHYIWIETPAVVPTGETVSLDVYFGEYHEGVREKRGGRLDERKGTELRMVSPSGKLSGPIDWKAEANRFSGQINLGEAGVYSLIGTDAKSPVVDYTKYGIGVVRPIFYTRTHVLSFEQGSVGEHASAPGPALDLDIVPLTRHLDIRSGQFGPQPKEEVVYQLFFKGQPLTEKADIVIGAPNGWLWEGKTDSQGTGRFAPLWPGRYVIDVVFKEKTPGTFEGKNYEAVRHRATLSLIVQNEAASQ